MAITLLQGNECHTNADLPAVNQAAPDFCATNQKLEKVCLADFGDKTKLIYCVPSLDTFVCAKTARQLDELATGLNETVCIVISADLPFAQQRFCKENKLKNITTLSLFQFDSFAKAYGVLLIDGPLQALTARAVFVLDASNTLVYQELTNDIAAEPDFDAAIQHIS